MISFTLNDQNHISENCNGSVIIIIFWLKSHSFTWSGVYDLYCSQPPGGDQRARSFSFKDEWDTPVVSQQNETTVHFLITRTQAPGRQGKLRFLSFSYSGVIFKPYSWIYHFDLTNLYILINAVLN